MLDNQEFTSAFPSKNSFVSLSNGDASLWNIKNGRRELYLSASDCHTTFSCLSWKVMNLSALQTKDFAHDDSLDTEKKALHMVIGTSCGDILIINKKGKEVAKFCDGHHEQVNCVAWSDNNMFYTGSNDRHITEWSLNEQTHKWKWKAHVIPVTSLLVVPNSKTIISAGKVIKLWDTKQKVMLKKFSGHSSEVFSMSILTHPSLDSLNGLTFLSSASDDKIIKIWKMDDTKKKSRPVHSFTLSRSIRGLNLIDMNANDKPMKLITVTEDDQIFLFSLVINGTPTTSLTPIKTIKLLTKDACSLKVLDAVLIKNVKSKSHDILLSYGSSSACSFKTIDLSEHEEDDIIVYCSDPKQDDVKLTPKKKLRKISDGSDQPESTIRKRRNSVVHNKEKSFDEGSRDEINDRISNNPLAKIFQEIDETVVQDTVRSIPNESVSEFLLEKLSKLPGNSTESLKSIRWLKEVIKQHPSMLSQMHSSSPIWKHIQLLRNSQNQFTDYLPRLQGSLDLILCQIVQRKHEGLDDDVTYVFENESSDEDMQCLNYDFSDSCDMWDVENTDPQETLSDTDDDKLAATNHDSDDSDNNISDESDDET